MAPLNRALTIGQLRRQVAGAAFPVSVSKATVVYVPANQAPAAHSEPVRHTKSDPAYLPFIDNSKRQFSINGYFPERVLADTECVPVIMGSTMAKLCRIDTVPTDIVLRTAANTTETVLTISRGDVTIVLLGQHGERMTVHCRVLVNRHETK